jgi:hypothetical protein
MGKGRGGLEACPTVPQKNIAFSKSLKSRFLTGILNQSWEVFTFKNSRFYNALDTFSVTTS